jgi:hypothetical protein
MTLATVQEKIRRSQKGRLPARVVSWPFRCPRRKEMLREIIMNNDFRVHTA